MNKSMALLFSAVKSQINIIYGAALYSMSNDSAGKAQQ